jgi:hypothetical protein
MPLTECNLSVTRRCAKSIVTLAQKYNPSIKAMDNAQEGAINPDMPEIVNIDRVLKLVKVHDMILNRTRALCVHVALRLVAAHIPCMILGKSFGYDVLNLMKRYNDKAKASTCKDLLNYIVVNEGTTENENPGNVIEASDDLEVLKIMLETCETLESVETKVLSLFGENVTDKVIISTVHKSKGLEANTVYVNMNKLPMVHETIQNNQDMIFQETVCLPYVAFTRAKNTLIMFSYEKTCKIEENQNEACETE